MGALDSLLTTLGLLFFMFLVLAASVESILEMFRGLLEAIGITYLKGKYSVDDALKLANEFAKGDDALKAKLEGLKCVADQIGKKAQTDVNALDKIKTDLATAAGITPADTAAKLNEIAGRIRTAIDSSESTRIFILRLISAAIGIVLVWQSDFHILAIIANTPSAPEFIKGLHNLNSQCLNIIVGGLGAAAGSSYWHDQLDRIRNIKSAEQQIAALKK